MRVMEVSMTCFGDALPRTVVVQFQAGSPANDDALWASALRTMPLPEGCLFAIANPPIVHSIGVAA